MSGQFESDSGQYAPRHGLALLQLCIVGLFAVFALRLWFLQIHKGEFYSEKARDNRLRQETMYAPRGLIRDRNGKLVAVNEPAYALALVREDCPDIPKTLERVAACTGIPLADLEARLKKGRRKVKRFEPLVLVPDISFDLLAELEANSLRWPGLEIVIRPKRYYPQGPLLAHILGYVAEASENEIEEDKGLALGDTVGKRGLELVQEHSLRGHKGLRQMEVDASGRRLKETVLRSPAAGQNLRLSIDLDLQDFITKDLQERDFTGGVVVMEPFTGQLLSMVTQPSFDNNNFAVGLTPEQWANLRDDPRFPLQNRVTQSMYPPGSTFKVVVAGAALYNDAVDPEKTVYCPGFTKLGRHTFRCWKKGGHGKVDFETGLTQSCDVYFYDLGQKLGIDKISEFAKACGFGSPTGIDLPHEKGGIIPTKEWKLRRFSERWQGGDNLNTAIGQGFTLATPLQEARYFSALLNGGKLLKPQLIATEKPLVQGTIPSTDEQRERLLIAMRRTVEGRGTAAKLRQRKAVMGGKTGTAQVVKLTDELKEKKTAEIEWKYRDHAWIASWGIKDGKYVVIIVMIEHGGGGSESAAPVARDIYNYLFNGKGAKKVKGEKIEPMANWPHMVGEEEIPEYLKLEQKNKKKGKG